MSAAPFNSLNFLRKAGIVSLGFSVGLHLSTALATGVPTSVDPSQVEKRFETREPAPLPDARIQNTVPPTQQLSKEAQERMAKKRFVLKKVAIDGATVFTHDDLKFSYDGMIGKEISLLDAQAIARKITDYYRAREYILSQAVVNPDVKDGTLRIRVVEGYIHDVVIQGDVKGEGGRKILTSYAQHLKAKRPVRLTDLERYLLLMDDLPGASAKGVVRPSRQPGAADLVVNISHKTYEASYTLDNRGSKFVGPFQHSATLAANGLLGQYDRTLLRFITTSPTTELRFFNLQHEEQLWDDGTRLILDASHSRTRPGDALKSANFDADSLFVQAKLVHPFLRSRQQNLTGRAMFDIRNTDTDFSNLDLSEDRLRTIRLGGAYDFPDRFSGVSLIDAEIAQGLDIFGATDSGTDRSRTDGEADFTKITLDAARTQPLPRNFSVFTAMTSQYSFSRLLAAEQFSLGGASYGRAYDPSELTGDHGVAAKVEVRYGQTLSDPMVQSYQVYGFYDIGRTWMKDGGAGANDKRSLASAGVGLRTNFSEYLSGNVEVACPLTKTPNNQGGRRDDPRLFFSVTGRF